MTGKVFGSRPSPRWRRARPRVAPTSSPAPLRPRTPVSTPGGLRSEEEGGRLLKKVVGKELRSGSQSFTLKDTQDPEAYPGRTWGRRGPNQSRDSHPVSLVQNSTPVEGPSRPVGRGTRRRRPWGSGPQAYHVVRTLPLPHNLPDHDGTLSVSHRVLPRREEGRPAPHRPSPPLYQLEQVRHPTELPLLLCPPTGSDWIRTNRVGVGTDTGAWVRAPGRRRGRRRGGGWTGGAATQRRGPRTVEEGGESSVPEVGTRGRPCTTLKTTDTLSAFCTYSSKTVYNFGVFAHCRGGLWVSGVQGLRLSRRQTRPGQKPKHDCTCLRRTPEPGDCGRGDRREHRR